MATAAADEPIDDVLRGLGLEGDLAVDARALLEQEGLTNRRKQRISTAKVPRVREAIDRHWRRACRDCLARLAQDDRRAVEVPRAACPTCEGSRNRLAVTAMVSACRRTGVARLVLVGGSPSLRKELDELVGSRLELRLVDGTRPNGKAAARRDVIWADLIVILGSSELAHTVSELYTRDLEARPKLITVRRRGIAAVADEVTRSDRLR
jgi:hypothetical protein